MDTRWDMHLARVIALTALAIAGMAVILPAAGLKKEDAKTSPREVMVNGVIVELADSCHENAKITDGLCAQMNALRVSAAANTDEKLMKMLESKRLHFLPVKGGASRQAGMH